MSKQLNTSLFPRPWSCHKGRVDGYYPFINGKIERVSKSKRNGWKATVFVDDCPMAISHHDTKAKAESHCAAMLDAYTKVHYVSK